MKALGGSYFKFVSWEQRAVSCSPEIGSSRLLETCFLAHQKRFRNGYCLAASIVPSISASLSAQTDDESEEIQSMHSEQSKTVRVRFKLHKECTFGQQFLVAGDDPIVGSWDPSNGVPLIWSQGHVWTAEMDIPSGKVIKYKFILKGDGGDILWQPGPDRVLETRYTDKIITVFEDWDDAEIQNIVEDESLIVAENSNQPMLLDEEIDVANGHKDQLEIITEERRINILDEGVRVLVPGLIISTPSEEIEERNEVEIIKRVEKTTDETEDSIELEETSEKVVVDQTEQINCGCGAEHIVGGDFQWGRRTLQKLLSNILGFQ